ncbi:hypothetical protein EGH23_24890 [Halomicroarcula sp. F27]|uniref:Uncharacterized protein n=1 Tax=Haloarcula nitratireducens TaxID=2487749 RepID=A0AAW4PL59_9EURY|nr:hypothetical protein [Halomicroarcula nitratireducens]MBX0298105.1 hypothetical protein [Halomicroarcula nitratireducens]
MDFVEIALQEQLFDMCTCVGPFDVLFHEVGDGLLSCESQLVIPRRVEVLLEVIERSFLAGGERRPRVDGYPVQGYETKDATSFRDEFRERPAPVLGSPKFRTTMSASARRRQTGQRSSGDTTALGGQ